MAGDECGLFSDSHCLCNICECVEVAAPKFAGRDSGKTEARPDSRNGSARRPDDSHRRGPRPPPARPAAPVASAGSATERSQMCGDWVDLEAAIPADRQRNTGRECETKPKMWGLRGLGYSLGKPNRAEFFMPIRAGLWALRGRGMGRSRPGARGLAGLAGAGSALPLLVR